MTETVFRNARIVQPDRIVEGNVVVRDGVIDEIDETIVQMSGPGVDLEGDWLIPGLVELHTDHLEGHYSPRPKVRWNPVAAVQAHDAQIAASGITTVFDALRIGMDEDTRLVANDMQVLGAAIAESRAAGRLRADHYIHLRCEVSASDAIESFEHFLDEPLVRLASLMDHTPGQRQFTSLDAYKTYYLGKSGMTEAELLVVMEKRIAHAEIYSAKQRQLLAAKCRERGIVLASHDDATIEHVAEAAGIGVLVAEFPTTMEAARASRDAGMKILMGAPNIVRGGSHSGNVAARSLVEAGLLDVLSSDYLPFSLLHATFRIANEVEGIDRPQALAFVSLNPATAAGMDDRGAILPGRRADLVQVRTDGDVPLVRTVWRQGLRVV